jgi:hypothetical protein
VCQSAPRPDREVAIDGPLRTRGEGSAEPRARKSTHWISFCLAKWVPQVRTPWVSITALCSLVALVGACGADGDGSAAPGKGAGLSDGSAVTVADASRGAIADTGGPRDGASSIGDETSVDAGGGVIGIYKNCGTVALTQRYNGPGGFTLDYPAGWTGSAAASNSYEFEATYSYLPTGSSVPSANMAVVTTLTGGTATDATDVQTILASEPSGFPGALVRWFTIGTAPAAAWWYEAAPAVCGECAGSADPGPDLIHISVAAADGLDIVEIHGYARVDAPEETFCDIQAIEGSLAFP